MHLSVRCYTGRPGDTSTRQPNDKLNVITRVLLACALTCALSCGVIAQERKSNDAASEAPQTTEDVNPDANAAPVEIDGRTVLSVYSAVAGFTPEERAAHIQSRILGIAQRRDLGLDLIHTEERGAWTEVLSGDKSSWV
jgi:hypothetical protein